MIFRFKGVRTVSSSHTLFILFPIKYYKWNSNFMSLCNNDSTVYGCMCLELVPLKIILHLCYLKQLFCKMCEDDSIHFFNLLWVSHNCVYHLIFVTVICYVFLKDRNQICICYSDKLCPLKCSNLNPCVFNNKVGNILHCFCLFVLEHWNLNRQTRKSNFNFYPQISKYLPPYQGPINVEKNGIIKFSFRLDCAEIAAMYSFWSLVQDC